jgi:hypothetical protein
MATTLFDLANIYTYIGEFNEAKQYVKQAQEIVKRHYARANLKENALWRELLELESLLNSQ